MGRRSVNLFKRNDVMRAVNAARDAGVPVASVEIVTNDGTIIKVHGPDATRHDQPLDTWLDKKAGALGEPATDERERVSPVSAAGRHAASVRWAKPRAKAK